jgi:outer membrane lipoprotein-sorting protein
VKWGFTINGFLFFWLPLLIAQSGDVVGEFNQKIDQNLVFTARVDVKSVHPQHKKPTLANGTFFLFKDGYRLELEDRIFLIVKNESRVWELDQKRLIVSAYTAEEDEFAPSAMLRDDGTRFTRTEKKNKKRTTVNLKAIDDFESIRKATVEFDEKGMPLSIEAVTSAGETLTIAFKDTKIIPLNANMLAFSPSETFELIDLRQ